MKGIKKCEKYYSVTFEEEPEIKSQKDVIRLLNILIKADDLINEDYALIAIKKAIKKGLVC
jgi:hypothetical protein